jgi:predicted RNase H-like nuclease
MRRVLTNRYSFLMTDLEDLVRKCITKAGIVGRIYNSKCRCVLFSDMFSSYREVRECSIVRGYSLYTIHFSRRVRKSDGHYRSRANLKKGIRVFFLTHKRK